MVHFLLYQPDRNLGFEGNLKRMMDVVEKNRAHFYIFPELYLTGYLIRDEIYRLNFSRDDEIFMEISKRIRDSGKNIIFGFPEKENGFIYNSAMLIIENGNINVYRKIKLPNFGPFEEKLYFKEGKETFVFETKHGKIGIEICYDIFFPEITKEMALNGADFVVNISASPITSRALFENLMPARAIESTVYFIYNNWAGTQRSFVFWGGSQIHSPRGRLVKKGVYYRGDMVMENLDKNEIKIGRNFRPVLRDS